MVMNTGQFNAIRSLERAFKKCEQAHLAICGMDTELLVWDIDDYKYRTKTDSICNQQYLGEAGNQGIKINTHGTYQDSGGW